MDLLKTPSVQSLLDSDLESVESLQYLDIEELDEVEYALPTSEAPTLAEVLSANEDDIKEVRSASTNKNVKESSTCSALQVDFMQAVSQQLTQAQERSSAGAATALSVSVGGRVTVGTAHGHLLSFSDQTLRWVCDSNVDRGAVSCLAYNQDGTRLLVGYARGLICQYESIRGLLLRRVTLGGELWGTLRVTWAGSSGLALDTGGSVWLIKFSRPLGVRSARTSCLFSGARGEVVAMTARDARILALATLSRIIIVAGGRAAGVRFGGPPDTLPVLEWCENDDRVLVCGRAKTLQWLSVNVTGSSISLRPLKRIELKTTPLWLGWLGGTLAIFDADENLRLWGEDYDKPLDLSHIEPVYASAFFKGLWTDGRVSRAMCTAGVSALAGAYVVEGALSLLGRKGIVRVRPRDTLARAKAFLSSEHHLQALRLLCSAQGTEAKALAQNFLAHISDRPHVLNNRNVAEQVIKLCLKFNLSDELWTTLWEHCSGEIAFVEALGDAVVRGDLTENPPSPDSTQALIERLAEFEPALVERVVASLPLTSLDPHRASVFTRKNKLWRGVGAIAAALGGSSGAMRELAPLVVAGCEGGGGCAGGGNCAGDALVLAAADALAGRGAAGRPLPDHARPSARHDALHTLLTDDPRCEGWSPLRVLVWHDAAAAVRLLEQSAREPPFAGPLAKQNRLRVARALLAMAPDLHDSKARTEILEFVTGQISTGALPADQEVLRLTVDLAAMTSGERADRAWLALIARPPHSDERLRAQRAAAGPERPRLLWRIDALLRRHQDALDDFFLIEDPSTADVDELFEFLHTVLEEEGETVELEPRLSALIDLRPRAAAAILPDRYLDSSQSIPVSVPTERTIEFAESLLEAGRLRGPVAAAHLRALCVSRPGDAREFLARNPGVVRPEEALEIVRETGASEAEAICLEAAGDASGALDAILRRAGRGDEAEDAAVVAEAASLCARAAAGAPPAVAADMWARVVRRAGRAPPALLLEAAAHVPAGTLVARWGRTARSARALLACAAGGRRAWASAARVAGREAHEAVARALAAAARGLAVRGRCSCGRRLAARPPVRTTHCARATHVACGLGPAATCACGRRLPEVLWALPTCPQRRADSPTPDFALRLVAPPRPDLEGVV